MTLSELISGKFRYGYALDGRREDAMAAAVGAGSAIAEEAENVQLRCAATMDQTRATTRLVPKDRQRAYALQMLLCGGPGEEDLLVDLRRRPWTSEPSPGSPRLPRRLTE
jgi:hypothetical protein